MSLVTLDLAFTLENVDHDHSLVLALIQIAIEDLPLFAVELRDALRRNENEQLRHLAHAIKGLASNFRAEPLTSLANQLEVASRDLQSSTVKHLADSVSIACERTVAALSTELEIAAKAKSSVR